MKFSKRYVLIDQDTYHRLTNSCEKDTTKADKDLFQHPGVKATKTEQERMQRIANDDSLSDSEKLRHHSQALKRYLENFKDAVKLSKSEAILGERKRPAELKDQNELSASLQPDLNVKRENDSKLSEESITKPEPALKYPKAKTLTMEKIVKNLPTHKKSAGQKLLRDIKTIPALKWSNDGSVIYRGKTIPGSDISKLVSDTVAGTERKESKLTTRNKFNKILEENGVVTYQTGNGSYSNFKRMIKCSKWICHE